MMPREIGDGSHSILEYRENYKQAALEKGGTILFEEQGYLTFNLPGDDGSTTWCEVHIWNKSQQDIHIIVGSWVQEEPDLWAGGNESHPGQRRPCSALRHPF